MPTPLPHRGRAARFVLTALVLIAGWPSIAAVTAAPELSAAAVEGLVQGTCGQIVQGHFAEALQAVAEVPEQGTADPRVKQLREWLTEYDALSKRRDENRKRDFDRYVSRTKTLIEQLKDPQYSKWILRVCRAYGQGIDHGETDEDDERTALEPTPKPDEAVSEARKAQFTAAVDAYLEGLEPADRRERYRRWALADLERYQDGRAGLSAIRALSVTRNGAATRGALTALYRWAVSLRAARQVRAADTESRPGVAEHVRRLEVMFDEGPNARQYAKLLDGLLVAGVVTDFRNWVLGDVAAEIVVAGQTQTSLARVVEELYSPGEALLAAQRAMVRAADEQAFRDEAWVEAFAADVVQEAVRLMSESEWTKAMRLYVGLETLYPREKHYRDKREECVDHVRIARFYRPDNKWEEELRNIDPAMSYFAFKQIQESYVTVPDFKGVASSGLRALLLLLDADTLPRVFPSLGNDVRKGLFANRLEERLRQVERKEKLKAKDVEAQLDRAIEINEETVRLPTSVIVSEFTNGALESLDRFTSVIWPAELDEFRKRTIGQFSGVGIQIMIGKDGWLTVVQPLEDTPAYQAGIAPDDRIVKIDGVSTKNIFIEEAVKKITGPEGTEVVLTIRRPDGSEYPAPIKRARIEIKTVKGERRDETGHWQHFVDEEHKIAYVRVTSFTEKTVDDLRGTQRRLSDMGARGLILDLRSNPGGLLRSAVDMADLFLDGDKKIVSTRGQHSKRWSESATDGESFPRLPLIVLVNDRSASASEIVAGALQDNNNRALIIGERTFGKGSVQNLIPLGGNQAYLKLTTAHYYLPSGRLVHKKDNTDTWGVDPDISVRLVPEEIRAVLLLQRKYDVLQGKKQNEAAEENGKKPAEVEPSEPAKDELDVDPQIETALLVMRAHLLSRKPWSAIARADHRTVKTQ